MDNVIVFASELPAATLSDRVGRGELRRLAPGVYTADTESELTAVTKGHWHAVVGGMMPGAVITDRSAPNGGTVDGILYLAHSGRPREISLPGLTVLARTGAAALDGDIELPGGLYQASKGRALIENTRPSRSRKAGRPRRTLDETELGDWIDRLAQIDGEARLAEYRTQAENLAQAVGASARDLASVSAMIGAALGTREVKTGSPALAARQARLPYDQDRLSTFDHLIRALRASAPQNRPVPEPRHPRYESLPFYEAYFSNFIEGTEFVLDEAVAVVYNDLQIPGRSGDSHDLIGAYQVVADLDGMSALADSPDDFLQLLRSRHAVILGGRPDKNPGQFKQVANQAGASLFVLPGLVPGTLSAGWQRLAELDTPFERSVYMMFLVSEVHPFDDGNGRIARVMMNAELVAGGQSRIIVPTVFRDDYLGALRQLTRADDPRVLIKALRYAHDYTAAIDFSTLDGAERQLRDTNAFNEPDSADRLRLPVAIRAGAG